MSDPRRHIKAEVPENVMDDWEFGELSLADIPQRAGRIVIDEIVRTTEIWARVIDEEFLIEVNIFEACDTWMRIAFSAVIDEWLQMHSTSDGQIAFGEERDQSRAILHELERQCERLRLALGGSKP